MRLVAFLQLFNENETENLVRVLENCRKWADDIYIYDDCSTDGSQEVYKQYTEPQNIIHGIQREFNAELFHKKELFDLVKKTKPDWIGWIDGDTTLNKHLTENAKEFLADIEAQGFDGSSLHNINLWRHPSFFRTDNKFNGLWHIVFWKNTNKLHYAPIKKLHRPQYPVGMENIYKPSSNVPLLHYGFSSKLQIIKKYLIYKSYGQNGWALDRLIDETTSYSLEKVDSSFYPNGPPKNHETIEIPPAITYNEYRQFNSWEEFKKTDIFKELLNDNNCRNDL